MFHKDMPSSGDPHAGLWAMTAISIAITVPFIFYFKSIADSLHTIAEDRAGYRKARKYRE